MPTQLRAFRAVPTLILVCVLVAAVSVAIAVGSGGIDLTGASLDGTTVLVTLTNTSAQTANVVVTVYYNDGKSVDSLQKVVKVGAGLTVEAPIQVNTLTDDINPVGMTEGPDPIPHYVGITI